MSRDELIMTNSVPPTTTVTTVTPVAVGAAQHHTDADATHNFEYIDEVEYGPRKGEDGYDTDQSLAPRPRPTRKLQHQPLDVDHPDYERCDCLENFGCCNDDSCLFFASREECAKRCGLHDQCQNQRLSRKQFAALEQFDAGPKGFGLRLSSFATASATATPQEQQQPAAATKGTVLCEYTGRAIRASKLPTLFRRYQHDRRLYIMSLGNGVYIDARKKGGLARYMNHSCRPNCKVELWTVKGIRRAAVVVLNEPIQPGDELTFDYQWERKRGRAPTVCHCGVPECRGTLEMSITKEEVELQRELEGHWEDCSSSSNNNNGDGDGNDDIPGQQRRRGLPPRGDTLVNRTVRIYSTVHDTYFLGEVTGYDMTRDWHQIFYPHDKSEEWIDLAKETTWMVLNETVDMDVYNIARKSGAHVSRKRGASSLLLAATTTTSTTSTLSPRSMGGSSNNNNNNNNNNVTNNNNNSTNTNNNNNGTAVDGGYHRGVKQKNYLHVQTHVKEKLGKTIEIVQRNCGVQIQTQQRMRSPVPPASDEEQELYAALDKSLDGTVWKLTIKGEKIGDAYDTLVEKVKKFQDDTNSGGGSSSAATGLSTSNHGVTTSSVAATAPTVRAFDATVPPSITDVHEVVFPRKIADAVKRKLATVRDACRNVTILAAPSESKTKLIGKLVIEGTLLSDIEAAKEHLWAVLMSLCQEFGAPKKSNDMYRDLGFLGGALSNDQFQHLFTSDVTPTSPTKKQKLNFEVSEDLDYSPLMQSFESTNHCSVWVHVQDDQVRLNRAVNQTTQDAMRKIYVGCKPSEVVRLGAALQERALSLARGVRYISRGSDVVNWGILTNDARFFDFVKRVTGVESIEVDPMTDHLRIDGKLAPFAKRIVDSRISQMTDTQRASLVCEIIRLQIECYRDEQIRRHSSWGFGRDWNTSCDVDSPSSSSPVSLTSVLDRDTSCQCGMLIADIVAKLGLDPSVGGHSIVILYRFVCAESNTSTKMTVREGVLACIFLANKSQKVMKWKSLDLVVQAGYEIYYKGAQFDKASVEGKVLTEKVLLAESEILRVTQYDIYWSDIKRIYVAATGATEKSRPIKKKSSRETDDDRNVDEVNKVLDIPEHDKMSWTSVKEALNVSFSGPVLGAGAELWLKYDIDYIFAAVAVYIDCKKNSSSRLGARTKLKTYISAMCLSAPKLSQTAQLVKNNAKYGIPTFNETPTNKLFEQSGRLEKYMEPVLNICADMLRVKEERETVIPAKTRYQTIRKENRQIAAFQGVSIDAVKKFLLPRIDSVAAESSCRIYITRGGSGEQCDILLEGTWRAITLAGHLVRATVDTLPILTDPVDSQLSVEQGDISEQVKALPGLLKSSDIVTGWNGSMQSHSADDTRETGSRYCIGGKASEACLQKAGLRWWIPPPYGANTTGSIVDSCLLKDETSSDVELLVAMAKHISCEEEDFPVLLTQLSIQTSCSNKRFIPLSFQRWPNEKAAKKERGKRLLNNSDQIGFTATGLQELQLLKQLHCAIESPLGHPNFILPLGIAIPEAENDTTQDIETNEELYSKVNDSSSQENIDMLFQTNTLQEDISNKPAVPNNALLVLQPTPFALQRFLSKKGTTGGIDSILPAWFHDILSALVHCHSNGILLCNALSADLIFVDPCGTVKFGGMYKWSVLPLEGWVSRDPIAAAKAKTKVAKRKNEKDDFVSSDLYTAPEILLGCPDHSKESDVWAVGCLLAHLLVQKPLFKGKDRADRLLSQFKIAGAPKTELFPSGQQYPHYTKPPKKYRADVPGHLTKLLDDEEIQRYTKPIDLIANMVVLDPAKRWTAEVALESAYMVDYRTNCLSAEYRQQFVSEWMDWKEQVTSVKDGQSRAQDAERTRKRMALMATTTTTGGDDDLYDLADFMSTSTSATTTSSPQPKKHKPS